MTEVMVSMFGTTIRTSCSVAALRVDKCNFYDTVLARCARRRRQRVSFRLALTGTASQLSHFTHFLAEKSTPSENSLESPTTYPTIPPPTPTFHITQELGSIQFEGFILLSSTHPSYGIQKQCAPRITSNFTLIEVQHKHYDVLFRPE